MEYPDLAAVLVRDEPKRFLFGALKARGIDFLFDGLREKGEILQISELPVRYFSIAS